MSRLILFLICIASIVILIFSVYKQEKEGFQEGKLIGYLFNNERRRFDTGGNEWEVYVFQENGLWEFYLKPVHKGYNFVHISSSNIVNITPQEAKNRHFKGDFIVTLDHPELLKSPYKMVYISKTILI